MKEKTVYSFKPENGEYIGELIARQSPLDEEEVYLIPAYATEIEPIFEEGKITKFVNNEWVLENIPTPPEPTPPTLEERKQSLKNQLIGVRLGYLSSTDWYIAREMDEPNSYPQEIKNKRIQARQEINDIEASTTLTALNAFSTTFE